ncbi:MAG: helix-turn-helix transcriptional regulator [Hydrogeniiclostridium sp.]
MTYEEVSTIIGENLKKFRAAIHLSQLATATGIGMAEAHYRSLEHGESNPELKTLCKVCWYFGIELKDLVSLCKELPSAILHWKEPDQRE